MAIRRTPDAASETKRTRANTGAAEQAMRAATETWLRARYGDVRIIHELAFRDRRIDMVAVATSDIIGVEIKGPNDSLSDGRLTHQLREYNYFLPEVWLAVAPKWLQHPSVAYERNLLIPTERGMEIAGEAPNRKFKPRRDECCCSRLIELLWNDEAARIAQRTDVLPGRLITSEKTHRVRSMLARLLTGHEIMKQVCIELRARPLTGLGSDPPVSSGPLRGEIPTNGLATTPDARYDDSSLFTPTPESPP